MVRVRGGSPGPVYISCASPPGVCLGHKLVVVVFFFFTVSHPRASACAVFSTPIGAKGCHCGLGKLNQFMVSSNGAIEDVEVSSRSPSALGATLGVHVQSPEVRPQNILATAGSQFMSSDGVARGTSPGMLRLVGRVVPVFATFPPVQPYAKWRNRQVVLWWRLRILVLLCLWSHTS